MADVFISYVEEDGDAAGEIARGLTESGISAWRYEHDAIAGEDYLLQTRRQIEACAVFLIIISPQSLASVQVYREVVRAHECGKSFVPVLREITYHEFGRRNPEWEQAMGGATAVALPRGDVVEALPRMVEGVQLLLKRPARARRGSTGLRRRVVRRRIGRISVLAALLAVVLGGIGGGAYLFVHSRASAARARAAAAMESGDLSGVVAAVDWVIDWFPDDIEARILRARAQGKLGDAARAKVELDEVIRRAPRHASALGFRATAFENLHQPREALADLELALEIDPSRLDFRYRTGLAYDLLNEPAKAEAAYGAVVAADPGDVEALVQRAVARGKQQKNDEALADLEAALLLNPSLAEARGMRGAIKADLGRIAEAQVDLEAALQMPSLAPEMRPLFEDALRKCLALAGGASDLRGSVQHNVNNDGRRGLAIVADFEIRGFADRSCTTMATILDANGRPLNSPSPEYATGDGYLAGWWRFTPRSSPETVRGQQLFIPYGEFPPVPGRSVYRYDLAVFDAEFRRISVRYTGEFDLTYTPP